MVARFGDEVTLKRFVRLDDRNVELRPESYNPAHEVMKLDFAKHILDIDGLLSGRGSEHFRPCRTREPRGDGLPRSSGQG